ncbi:MAG: hypothetical protein HKN25_07085 [Pyrinomonadaceae bacterium]|nr:hypothetical protein [Pyrinomonadaceae bacterium]
MKVCPQCQNKYTDDTLKYCLQDGKPLDTISDEKTLVLDPDSFANDKTVADNFEPETVDEDVTEQVTVDKKPKRSTVENRPQETVADNIEAERTAFASENQISKRGGVSFVSGFLLGVFLLVLIGAGVLAAWKLPGMLATNEVSNSNTNAEVIPKPKIINNSPDVKISASSTRRNQKGNKYDPSLAFDGNSRTAWAEGARGAGVGQWIAFDFEKEVNLKQIVIEPGYFKTLEIWEKNNRLKSATVKFSDNSTRRFEFQDVMEEQKLDVGGKKTKSVMITIKSVYRGKTDSLDTLISEVSFALE